MESIIQTNEVIVNLQSPQEINLTVLQADAEIQSIQSEEVHLSFTDIGVQGLPGAQGPIGPIGPIGQPLTFELLSEQQKLELRGDVGNTSTNYTNLFNSVLLS